MPSLEKFYEWCVETCNEPNVGYSQDYRGAQTVNGITYYDCSSFVYYALKAGGWSNLPKYPFTTYSMIPVLLQGGWYEVPSDGIILAGDIGWCKEHTEVAYSNGENGVAVFMGAHDDSYPVAEQVSIGVGGNPSIPRTFDKVFRYNSRVVYHMDLEEVSAGCVGLSVLTCQKELACCGLYQGEFDGIAGPKTVLAIMDFQSILVEEGKDVLVDGICGAVTWKELVERHS